MSKSRTTLALFFALVAVPNSATAQSESAIAGWVSLISTPTGAFAPALEPHRAASSDTRTRVGGRLRASHWQFASDDDNTTNYGGALVVRRGRVHTTIELGISHQKGCDDCDLTMGGVEVTVPVLTRATSSAGRLEVGIKPALGYTRGNDGDGIAIAAAFELPVSWAIPVGETLRLTPFVAPGVGGGRVSGGGDSSSGARMMIAGGLALQGARTPFALTFGARRIFVDFGEVNPPTVLGLGFTFIP